MERSEFKSAPEWVDEARALTVDEAARYCGVSTSYLNKLRVFGGGPVFSRAGRLVRYSRPDLDTWRNARRFGSTSEYAAA